MFSGKILFRGKRAIFGLKMAHPHNFGSALSIFFQILHNERGQEVDRSYN